MLAPPDAAGQRAVTDRSTVGARLAAAAARNTEAQAVWDEQVAQGRLVHIATLL